RRVAQYAIALTTRIPYTYTLSLHDALPILYLPSKTKDMERTIQPDIPYISGINIANGALLKCGNGRVCIVADASPFTALLKGIRSEEHTSELQSRENLVCRLLLEKKKQQTR